MGAKGGARPGSGRKPLGDGKRVTTAVSLPPDLVARAKARAGEEGRSFSELVNASLHAYLGLPLVPPPLPDPTRTKVVRELRKLLAELEGGP